VFGTSKPTTGGRVATRYRKANEGERFRGAPGWLLIAQIATGLEEEEKRQTRPIVAFFR
jgi:hypothetical protein